MFESLLIANRGEIACRIIRTCRRLGIRTIAVYSAADVAALHVAQADERHPIGPSEARQSYLRPEAIIEAALAHRATAIHPGYGFLSERVELAELCAAHRIAWVGPSPRCIAAMGSKIESKRIAEAAGVPCVPGYHGDDQSPARLLREALAIGFPVLIKASAGGGGRGMRRADSAGTFPDALSTARAESMAAFGDDRVLLEKCISRPRHLEVQLAGDRHGNLIHLFERECSIQRSYQKLVEEAPAPHLPPATRDLLLAAAIRLGQAIGYDQLGTVEFILEAGGSDPYFLEMNTRLQVEHPVTELITGLDLVELQLRIAAGEKLPLTQAAVTGQGSAIELRLNAEDPAAGFRPQIGRVTHYRAPEGPGLRIDSGITAGSEVTPFYDSLLLKLIAHGPDRTVARRRLDAALSRTVVLGTGTNQAFLRDIIRSPDFGNVLTTQFIAENFPDGWQPAAPGPEMLGAVAVAMAAARPVAQGPWGSLTGFRIGARAGLPGRTRYLLRADGLDPVTVDVVATPEGLRALHDGALLESAELAFLAADGDWVSLVCDGVPTVIEAVPLIRGGGRGQGNLPTAATDIVAAMPGVIARVLAVPGQEVRRGDVLVVQEAMKLMLSLSAAIDGTVRAVHCTAGQIVGNGALLVEIAPAQAADGEAASSRQSAAEPRMLPA